MFLLAACTRCTAELAHQPKECPSVLFCFVLETRKRYVSRRKRNSFGVVKICSARQRPCGKRKHPLICLFCALAMVYVWSETALNLCRRTYWFVTNVIFVLVLECHVRCLNKKYQTKECIFYFCEGQKK